MQRGYGDEVNYSSYPYDTQFYPQNGAPAVYPPPYIYQGNPFAGNQHYMSWNPVAGVQPNAYSYSAPPHTQGYQPPFYHPDAVVNYGNVAVQGGYEDGQSQGGENGNGQTRKYSYSQNRNRNGQRPESKYNGAQRSGNTQDYRFPQQNENSNEVNGLDKDNYPDTVEDNNSGIQNDKDDHSSGMESGSRPHNGSGRYQNSKYSNKYSNQNHRSSNNRRNKENAKHDNQDRNNNADGESEMNAVSEPRPRFSNGPGKSYTNQRLRGDNDKSRKDSSKFQRTKQMPGSEIKDKSIKHNENNVGTDNKTKKIEKYPNDNYDDNMKYDPHSDSNAMMLDPSNGARKKKKETSIYSSSGHRDGRSSNQQDTYNQQRSHNRFNYRGMDYNKRHKDGPGIQRGGERTKLSEKEKEEKEEGKEEKNDGNSQRKNQIGPNVMRGTRLKRQMTFDESQRGVLTEQLTKGTYECMVCCESVRSQNAVWSCSGCYHIFHLRCIKQWARSPNSVVSGAERDGWRCPACQNLSFKFPNQYRCFCGKVKDPEMTRMDTPHSCGDVCKKNRGESCKHPCNILCHPGPCPECNVMVTKSCDCGKTKQTVRCGQSSTIKCESICERLLNCGKHFCSSQCHSGSCEKCDKMVQQECYGEHESREVLCGSEEAFTESYSCKVICARILDCGNHTCESACHRGDCVSCPGLPANVTHCPCGAKSLTDLDGPPRSSCSDPIPTCDNVCNKPLLCGPAESKHRCKEKCHEGPCGPCDGETMLTCRCLSMDKKFKCAEITQSTDENGRFVCERRCNRKKACGRHKCTLPCCIKEEHPCDLVCGRKLPCGLHKCDEPCHRNNCPPCLMANFDEMTCHCGAEVLYPPIPCATPPPECHRPCTRQHACDHTVRHNCHSEDKCPLCTELTKKWCMGKHVERANIPCHLQDISCGMKCSRPLPCGVHFCLKTCHRGECVEDGQQCAQPCPRKRESCDHACGLACHGEGPCPPSICKAPITIKCACGNRESPAQCSFDPSESSEYQRITMQSLKESLMGGSSVSISKFSQGKGRSSRVLECNEECALLERNRRVALALDIQNPDLTGKLGNPQYNDFLKDFAKQNEQFVAGLEKAFSDLVQTAKQSKQASRSHAFPSMNNNQRRVVHELAEFYGCETQSYDYEPNKNVVATAKKDKCWLPSVTLTTLIQRELHPRAPPPIPHTHKEELTRPTSQPVKQSTSLLRDSASGTDGWHVIGKKTKKPASGSKSAIATIDRFEEDLSEICATGTVDYASLSTQSKQALKSEPVVDYFDFTVN